MFAKSTLLFIIVYFIIKFSNGQRNEHFFRKDYKYLEATQSFYKIHTTFRTWFEAKKICANEGSTLFFPEDQNETDVVLSYLKAIHKFNSVFIGVSDLAAEGVFETIDGRSILDTYNKWHARQPDNYRDDEDCVELKWDGLMNDVSCTTSKPFICQKTLVSLQWNTLCSMPFLDYTYNETIGKCFKFHSNPRNWTDAHAMCAAELSYLAVINSQDEADYLIHLTEQYHKNKTGDYVRGAVLLGFHNQLNEGWTTVRGTSNEDSGYNKWIHGQPAENDYKRCGSMLYNGLLGSIECDKKSFFICEHDINVLDDLIDKRFGDTL